MEFVLLTIEENEMGKAYGPLVGEKNAYRVLVGKSEGERPLGRPMHRREDNIKTKF
jgi:hypothetical protein